MRLLLVEDCRPLAIAISRILRSAGYVVAWAADGEEALAVGLAGGFDAVVLDLVLPRRSGWDVLEGLRAAEVWTPVLVLSVLTETEAKVRALTTGADDHLGKPFEAAELVARVGALVRRGGAFRRCSRCDNLTG